MHAADKFNTACVKQSFKRFNYSFDSKLSEAVGVKGSPTLVINGAIVQSGRSSAAFLDTICQAFTEGSVPELCAGELDSANPAPGFGWDVTVPEGTAASCG